MKDKKDTKKCTKCHKEKKLFDFYKRGRWNKKPFDHQNYRSACKKCCLIQRKECRLKNYEEEKRKAREKRSYLYKTDPAFRLKESVRSRTHAAFKRIKTKGKTRISEFLGCSFEELKDHIEQQFYNHPETNKEMTWDNYGSGKGCWNIDHIMPLAFWGTETEEDIIELSHYTNLQPLWYCENMQKLNSLRLKDLVKLNEIYESKK